MVTLKIPSDGSQTSLNYSLRASCKIDLKLNGRPDWITDITIGVNTIDFTADNNDKGKERSVYLTPVVNGKECKSNKIQVIQEAGEAPAVVDCIRGTDNGNDWVNNRQVAHPMNLCAKEGTDEDSMYVNSLYFGETPSSENIINAGGPWIEIENWLRIKREHGGWYGGDKIVYSFTENRTGSVRRTSFKLSTTDSDVTPDAPPAKTYGKTNACKWWQIDVQQVSCGYYWCGDHSYTQEPVPCSQGCSSSSTYVCRETSQCTCEDEGFQINGHSNDFTDDIDACTAGNYELSITRDVSFSIEGDGVTINGRTQGNISAGNAIVAFTEVSVNTINKITFIHNSGEEEEKIILTLIRTCSPECNDCTAANIRTDVNSVVLDATAGSTAVIHYTASCASFSAVNHDARDFSYSFDRNGKFITITARTDNTSETTISTTLDLVVSNSDVPCKVISVSQKGKETCKLPDGTIDILIRGSWFPSQYSEFAIVDTASMDSECAAGIEHWGERISNPGDDYQIASYIYSNCEGSSDPEFENSIYNSCSSSRTKDIVPGTTYYLYAKNGEDGYTRLRAITIPSYDGANAGAEGPDEYHKYYYVS